VREREASCEKGQGGSSSTVHTTQSRKDDGGLEVSSGKSVRGIFDHCSVDTSRIVTYLVRRGLRILNVVHASTQQRLQCCH